MEYEINTQCEPDSSTWRLEQKNREEGLFFSLSFGGQRNLQTIFHRVTLIMCSEDKKIQTKQRLCSHKLYASEPSFI